MGKGLVERSSRDGDLGSPGPGPFLVPCTRMATLQVVARALARPSDLEPGGGGGCIEVMTELMNLSVTLRVLVAVVLMAACADGASGTNPPVAAAPSGAVGGALEVDGPEDACPLTIPPQPGFVPPEPYPPEVPALYQSVWYGDDELWTMLHPGGETWTELPEHEGTFGQKTLWWSARFSAGDEPAPSITVTGRQLDGAATFEAGGPGTNGFREDIGSFMLVGLEIPEAGCWELTARYGDGELTYVVFVDG